MVERLMGIEVELATAERGGDGTWSPSSGCETVMESARRNLAHVPGSQDSDFFLQNGARLYREVNGHVEFCTPEVDNPDDLVRYSLADEAILRDLVSQNTDSGFVLYKGNVDYCTTSRVPTWGLHENYCHKADPDVLPRHFTPYLVSRVCFCAGGLNPYCPGIQFSLSPRLHVFSTPVRECTMSGRDVSPERGIFNPRREHLASGGYCRLHIVCADSVCSQVALWLRVSSASLVLAMAEGGIDVGGAVQFQDPVSALGSFLIDPYFSATAPLTDGRHVTALQVQRHYLEEAERYLDHDCMPPWAVQTCERWRKMLDLLQVGPEGVSLKLDWAIKHTLFMNHIRGSGISPESVPHWNHVLDQVYPRPSKRDSSRVDADNILNSKSCRSARPALKAYMREYDLSWDQLRGFLGLRDTLCEIDIRFAQIVPGGIFDAMEPLLDHRLPGIDRIEQAKRTPPQGTRARLRGNAVRTLNGRADCRANWDFMQDERGLILDLSNPFARKARWRKRKLRAATVDRSTLSLHGAYVAYEKGDFDKAFGILMSARRRHAGPRRIRHSQLVSYLAWVQSRRGHSRESIALLEEVEDGAGAGDHGTVQDRVVVYRFRGLAPVLSEARRWIRRGDARNNEWSSSIVIADFLGNKGSILARTGSLHKAADVLRRACAIDEIEPTCPRLRARVMADMADVCRMLGERGEAAEWLDRVDRIHQCHNFHGERADFALTYRAKLVDDVVRARELLRQAARIQRRFTNHLGLARTLLLDARLTPHKGTATRRRRAVLELRGRVPDLRRCDRLRQILSRWDDWANGASGGENGDYFWLL